MKVKKLFKGFRDFCTPIRRNMERNMDTKKRGRRRRIK